MENKTEEERTQYFIKNYLPSFKEVFNIGDSDFSKLNYFISLKIDEAVAEGVKAREKEITGMIKEYQDKFEPAYEREDQAVVSTCVDIINLISDKKSN